MMQKCFTVETRLDKTRIPIQYFTWNVHKQCHLFRIVWKLIQKSKQSEYQLNTYLQNTYHIDKRTANSLIHTVKGRLNSFKAIKKQELSQFTMMVESLQNQTQHHIQELSSLKPKVTQNKASISQLKKYRKLKYLIWSKKQRINRLRQKIMQLQQLWKHQVFPVCWGTKKLFKAQFHLKENGFKTHQGWLNAYRIQRDSQINSIGAKSDRCGNQNFQLTYNKLKDTFTLKIRKDKEVTTNSYQLFIYLEELKFKYQKTKLIQILQEHNTPLHFRILRRNKKWYIQIIFTWKQDSDSIITNRQYGTIGLDYNVGFISMSETDHYGNLIALKHFPLPHHGDGNKAKSKLQEAIAKIVKIAVAKQKPIVIENLDFKTKKSNTLKANSLKGKIYNRIIHSFNYARYKTYLENACYRNQLKLIIISPYLTTLIGMRKYCEQMKLNRHQGASYIIARKGQGYQD